MKSYRKNGIMFYIYNLHDIDKLAFDLLTGDCFVYGANDELLHKFNTIYSVFNMQYHIPVFINESYHLLYIGNWENGLYCYNILNGRIQWHRKLTKTRHLFLFNDFVSVEVCNKGVFFLNCVNGETVKSIRYPAIDFMFQLSDKLLFFGQQNSEFKLYSCQKHEIIGVIDQKNINVSNYLNFVILEAYLQGNTLYYSGFQEQSGLRKPTDFTYNINIEEFIYR